MKRRDWFDVVLALVWLFLLVTLPFGWDRYDWWYKVMVLAWAPWSLAILVDVAGKLTRRSPQRMP